MRWILLMLAVTCAGCALDLSGLRGTGRDGAPPPDGGTQDAEQPDDDGGRDSGGTDASTTDAGDPPDANTCPWTYMPLYFDPCEDVGVTPEPFLNLDRSGEYTYDTQTGDLEDPDGDTSRPPHHVVNGVRIVRTVRFAIQSGVTLRVTGNLPLVIAARLDASVAGEIDASSSRRSPGANADPMDCPRSPPEAGQVCLNHAGSGGGGGGFNGSGGNGGDVSDGHDCGTPDTRPGGRGGADLGAIPTVLRGGCAGRDGAQNDSGTGDEGRGGPGGGAVAVSAGTRLTVTGTVHAGGAGGGGGQDNRAGGGGGGSGGMAVLEAGTIRIRSGAVVAANGGGGGGGCDNRPAADGSNGRSARSAASGGTRDDPGGDGGDGGFGDTPDGEDGESPERGGGGGGGSAGFVGIRSVMAPASIDLGATFSPDTITL